MKRSVTQALLKLREEVQILANSLETANSQDFSPEEDNAVPMSARILALLRKASIKNLCLIFQNEESQKSNTQILEEIFNCLLQAVLILPDSFVEV